ncbi:MAG: hypothetical protein ACI4F6_07660 [Acutalibacteraceae bacterium]
MERRLRRIEERIELVVAASGSSIKEFVVRVLNPLKNVGRRLKQI